MKKDYTRYSFLITALVIIIMLGISFIPPFTFAGIRFKRANIISDIYRFDDRGNSDADGGLRPEDMDFIEEMERLERESGLGLTASNTNNTPAGEASARYNEDLGDIKVTYNGEQIIRFQDFTPADGVTLAHFCDLLGTATGRRIVRVAFMGDSYIEGDIITADVRDQLQREYGGGGVGFVPFMTPLAPQRPTIKHTFEGWENHNLAQRRNAPEELQDKFYISGILSIPSRGAWTEYETTNFRRNLPQTSSARLFFLNSGRSRIDVTVNDSIEKQYTPGPSDHVQQISIPGSIKKLKINVTAPEGFTGYGVFIDGNKGVSVDNYSIRSNSGIALAGTNRDINTNIARAVGYDLIVLQYGLNAMDPSITNYSAYGSQMRRVINYMKSCFPNAAVIVMGVGDRSTLENGEFVTMEAVYAMLKEQEAAARDCGVVFWNTFEAMGGTNSMSDFVEKNWAAKDYTHLSYNGGRFIAQQFVKALYYHKELTAGVESTPDNNTAGGNIVLVRETSAQGETVLPADSSDIVAEDNIPATQPSDSTGTLAYPENRGLTEEGQPAGPDEGDSTEMIAVPASEPPAEAETLFTPDES